MRVTSFRSEIAVWVAPLLLFLLLLGDDERIISQWGCRVEAFSPSATTVSPSSSSFSALGGQRSPQQIPMSRPSILLHMSEASSSSSSATTTARTTRSFQTNSTSDIFSIDSSSSSSLSSSAYAVTATTTTTSSNVYNQNQKSSGADTEYKRGLVTIGSITLLFASNSPVLHAAFSSNQGIAGPPPVLLLNAAVSVVALVGLLIGGESLESNTPTPSSLLVEQSKDEQDDTQQTIMLTQLQGGCELGVWKFLGTTANLYGLALTTAGHGALLIQLTTLIVPVVQGIMGVPIPQRIQASVMLALAGVLCFTQDSTGSPSAVGDALCVVAAIFYATYDLRLFAWGKRVKARSLITTKIGTQAILSVFLLLAVSRQETMDYLASANIDTYLTLLPVIVWSGVAVNALAPFLQVGGQQAVGPTRCQTIYASQPLWAAMMSFMFLGEQIGMQGMVGGSAFLVALGLAATTAESPSPPMVVEVDQEH